MQIEIGISSENSNLHNSKFYNYVLCCGTMKSSDRVHICIFSLRVYKIVILDLNYFFFSPIQIAFRARNGQMRE